MSEQEPSGLLTIRTIAMPNDLNYEGDVFGGWLVSQMDLAGGIAARWRSGGRVTTVGIEAMQFHTPLRMGDELSCYCTEVRIGRTSMTYLIEVWVRRREGGSQVRATKGTFTYVALGSDGRPRPVPANPDAP
ncbi:acyl-CoA thioesterase [Telmatospirillum sp.]|uniref:acyl-CoA thioesterase n=1 Tax=Telmatospirillum sp. TaxID=2079197 RepID=UPI002845BD48|nr:acyl-CoA thioesterase [Telmatospirillum sp.]MDR3439346.1 acyl-CoA thioesterase [Telmatospirillum sp.]